MSKRVIGIKAIIEFFCLNKTTSIDDVIFEANKLINAYNLREENSKKLVPCNKCNIKAWLSIPQRIQKEIQGTKLEKIYYEKFVDGLSYIKVCQKNFISETTFYAKTKLIYEAAINFMYYERLFIVKDTELDNKIFKRADFKLSHAQ